MFSKMQEYIRADIVRAIQWNAAYPTQEAAYAVYSQPVELEPWPS